MKKSCPLCFVNVFNKTGSLEAHIKKHHPYFPTTSLSKKEVNHDKAEM